MKKEFSFSNGDVKCAVPFIEILSKSRDSPEKTADFRKVCRGKAIGQKNRTTSVVNEVNIYADQPRKLSFSFMYC